MKNCSVKIPFVIFRSMKNLVWKYFLLVLDCENHTHDVELNVEVKFFRFLKFNALS